MPMSGTQEAQHFGHICHIRSHSSHGLELMTGTHSFSQFTQHVCQLHIVVEEQLVEHVAGGDVDVMAEKVETQITTRGL